MTKPAFGCPFHGLVKGGSLTLPDASAMTYPQPASFQLGTSGITQRVQGAGAALPDRTPEQAAADTVKNHQWLDYAIVSGEDGQLCAQELGDHWHLYTDPAGVTWKMTARLYVSSSQVRVRVRLINAYGRSPKRWEDVDREILSVDYSLPNGESDPSEYLSAPAYLRSAERNSSGSVLLLHLYWGAAGSFWNDYEEDGFPSQQELRAVYKVTISGTGNYDNMQLPLGAGVGAASVLYKDLDDIDTNLSYDDSSTIPIPTWSCAPTACSDTQSGTVFDDHNITKKIVRLVFDSNDQEIEISYRSENHLVTTLFTRTRINCPGDDCELEEYIAATTTVKFNLLRDDVIIAESGDLVMDYAVHKLNSAVDSQLTITWRGLTLRDTTEDLFTLDALPGDHADGININPSIAFISPQLIGVVVKQAVRNGPGNFTLKRVHIGPAVAAEADDADIDQFDPATENWELKVFGSYEPGKKAIARATDGKVCYV